MRHPKVPLGTIDRLSQKGVAVWLFVLLFASYEAWAGALTRCEGMGTRDSGMGGDIDGIQLPDNYAAKTQLKNTWTDVTLEVLVPNFKYKPQVGKKVKSADEAYLLPYLHFGQPIGDWGAFGVDLKVPYGLGVNFKNNPQQLGFDTETLIALTRVSPSLALKLSDQWSIGGAVNFGIAQFTYNAPLDIRRQPLPIYTENEAHGLGIGCGVGVVWQPDEAWTFGLNYISRLNANLDGKSHISVGLFGIRDKFDSSFAFPARLDFATTWRASERLVLVADTFFCNYSKTPNDMALNFRKLGFKKATELGWKDSIAVRFGACCKLATALTVRAGIGYLTQAIPDSTISTLTPDCSGFGVGLGLTCKINQTVSLDASVTHGGGGNEIRTGAVYDMNITTVALAGQFTF